MIKVSFYCKKCGLDQDNLAEVNNNSYGEWFVSKCGKCGNKIIRYITEKEKDPYFHLSKRVIINRQKFVKDILQPGDYGFRIFYKKEYEKIQKAKEDFEKKEQAEKKERDWFLREHSQNIVEKNLAKKIIQNEEEIKYARN